MKIPQLSQEDDDGRQHHRREKEEEFEVSLYPLVPQHLDQAEGQHCRANLHGQHSEVMNGFLR